MSFACVQETATLSPHCLAVGPVLVVDDERALWLNVDSEFGGESYYCWLNRIP